MAKTKPRGPRFSKPPRRLPWWVWIAAPLAAVIAVFAYYAVEDRTGAGSSSQLEPIEDAPGVVHVHGLGVNPADGDLYGATHGGVFRITEDGRATRIANRYQDTMGFTIIGPDHFLASGHPDMREDLPPLLGLLESRDAGKTWNKKSLLGEADFHALRYAHDSIYGYDSTGAAFMASPDGHRWQTRSKTTLRDFVVSPTEPNVVLATTPNGLEHSSDGGRTWSRASSPPQPVLLDWEAEDQLWLVDQTGRIHLSPDAARTWEERGQLAQGPEAFVAADSKLYLAGARGIFVSADGGTSWEPFYQEGPDP